MFGSTTSNNSWSASTGFGNQQATNSQQNKPSTSLFGNSTLLGGGLFGSGNIGGANTSNLTGLFGNSANSNQNGTSTTNSSGGLFGNSNQNGTSNAASTGGLFGSSNSTNTAANTGSLFGKNNANQNSQASSLFGSNNPSNTSNTGGLFGNSTTNLNVGGLFGNSLNAPQPSTSVNTGGLFGSNQQSTTQNTGLSINTQTSSLNTGLFGNLKPSTGLFGNTSTSQPVLAGFNVAKSNNLFAASSNGNSGLNSDPYNAKLIFVNINRDRSTLPQSITENLFTNDSNKELDSKKRKYSYLEKPDNKKSSLLYRLGQTLKIFRDSNSSSYNPIRGLFRQSNYLNIEENRGTRKSPKVIEIEKGNFKPSKRAIINNANSGNMKRLIIKSKPLKFHLINADKVFNSKRRRIVTNVVLSDRILSDKLSSEDEGEDEEIDIEIKTKLSNKIDPNKVMVGESVDVNKLVEEVRETFDNGYWCSPPLKHLLQLPEDDLRSVENFIVGRDGYFQVAYDFGVDLNDLIKLALENGTTVDKQLFGKNKVFNMTKHGQLEVYLNYHTTKPPLGSGLNVPATITLEEIKPNSGSNTQDFIRKLRSQTGQEFITYDPIKFIWVFRVKHFSVWGLIDENNLELMAIKRKQDDQEELSMLEYTKIYESNKYEQELKKQKLSEYSSVLPGGWNYNSSNVLLPLAAKRDFVTNQVKNRIKAYKSEKDNDDTIQFIADSESVTSEILNSETAPIRDQNRSFEYLNQMVKALPRGTNYNDIIDEKAYEPELDDTEQFDRIQFKPNLPISKDWLVQLELANDIDSPLVPAETQKRLKVTIEAVDDILFDEFNKESLAFNESSTPTKSNKKEESDQLNSEKDVSDLLEEMIARANFVKRSNNYPSLSSINGISFANLIPLCANDNQKNLLRLASTLFDDAFLEKECLEINGNDYKLKEHVKQITLKRAFGEWLKMYNKQIIEPFLIESKNEHFEFSFLQICSGDLDGAVETLIETSNNHLSAILPLLDSNEDAVISIAKKQLEDWNDQGIISSIPAGCVKIYKLLARDFSTILLDLPWSIGLGVKLFYGDNSVKLADLIESNVQFEENNSVVDILLFYNQTQNSTLIEEFTSTSMNLKLLWIFNIILKNNGQISFKNDSLSQRFGDQLTQNRLTKEAAFVYTTILNNEASEKSQRNLIFTNIDVICSNSIDTILVSILKLPQSLIFEGIAHKNNLEKDYWSQCQALIDAKLWNAAHTTIFQQLGPQTIISNQPELKLKLDSMINQFPESGTIVPDWNKGAGIFHAFIRLDESLDNLTFILSNLPYVKDNSSFLISTALKIISRTVGDLAIEKLPDFPKSKIMDLLLSESDRQYFKLRVQC
jgi:nucleoporin NUP145